MERGIQHNTHPGELRREEVVKAHHLTVLKASQLLKVTRPTLSKILNGRSEITPDMAIRISRVFGAVLIIGSADKYHNIVSGLCIINRSLNSIFLDQTDCVLFFT